MSAELLPFTRGVASSTRIRGAVEVEPRAGGGVGLVIEDAEERNGLRAGEPVVNDHVVGDGAAGQRVHLNQRVERIDEQRRCAEPRLVVSVGVVHLHRLVVIEKLRAGRLGHGELRGHA